LRSPAPALFVVFLLPFSRLSLAAALTGEITGITISAAAPTLSAKSRVVNVCTYFSQSG
jgi:hypothetical protein